MTPKLFLFNCIGAILLCSTPASTYGQWQDYTVDYNLETTTFASWFGCGISTADFNNDGWDDFTASGADGWIKLWTGGPEGLTLHDEWLMPNECKAVLWFDIENDGDLDLLLGVMHVGAYLYVQQSDGLLLEESAVRGLPQLQEWDIRGFSARDYDRDGDLDVYISSYHDDLGSDVFIYENMLFQNTGSGYFEDVTMISGVGNGYLHSFQGAWMDFTGNGFDDLWVINDRSIFPNALYSNMGNGSFEDISEDVGADIGIEAMSATLFDPDNDGDWDQYVTNIENNPNAFLRNNDGIYEDIAVSAGVASMQYSWGACAIDVDGDRWDDLMVATYRFPNSNPYDNHLYMNLGTGLEFEDATENWPNEQFQLYCLGRIDLDNDRSPDIIGHGNSSLAQVLHNTNSEGNARMTISLIGTVSNTRAVGSVIKVHADGLTQMQQVDAGCDYMTQHTYKRFFGLANVDQVDSIEVFWPTGEREVLFDVMADTALTIVEGFTNSVLEPVDVPCPWSNAAWLAPFDPDEVEMTWNGVPVTSALVSADSEGEWTLEASWWGGAYSWSQTVSWTPAPEPEFTLDMVPPSCHGHSALLSWDFPEPHPVTVNGLAFSSQIESVPFGMGTFDVVMQVTEDCSIDTSFTVTYPPALFADVELTHPLCAGELGQAVITPGGGTGTLSVDYGGADFTALPAGIHAFTVSDSLGCTHADSLVLLSLDTLVGAVAIDYLGVTDSVQISTDASGGTPPYSWTWTAPLDSAGWVMAPLNLGWYVEDANGCIDLGAVELVSNPLAAVPLDMETASWACSRHNGGLVFNGPEGALTLSIFDLSGRQILDERAVRSSEVLVMDSWSPVLVLGQDEAGHLYRWIK